MVNTTSNATATVIKEKLISANGTEKLNFTIGSVTVAERVTQIDTGTDTNRLYLIVGVSVGGACLILLLLLLVWVSTRKLGHNVGPGEGGGGEGRSLQLTMRVCADFMGRVFRTL